MEQDYKQHRGNSRPESNRLQSAKNRPSDLKPLKNEYQNNPNHQTIEEEKNDNENSNSMQEQLQKLGIKNQDNIYARFSKFVQERRIERDDFCRPIHIFITQEELIEFFNAVEFQATKDEIFLIFKDHNAHKTGYLPMEEFYQKLSCWKNYQAKKVEEEQHVDNQANRLLEQRNGQDQVQRNNSLGGSKKRPTTAVVAGAKNLRALQSQQNLKTRLDSANKMGQSVGMKSTLNNQSEFQTKSYANIEDKTKHYLKLAKQKKEEEERALALTIDKGKRETEFDCLHKMGEACEIAKMLNIPVSFSAFKGPDGSLKIHFFQFVEDPARELPEDEGDQQHGQHPPEVAMREIKKEITMKEFYREYRKLKRMQNSVKNNYLPMGNTNGGQPGKPPNISQNTIVSSYSLNRINKKERQEELKQVLQETMKLTKKLKEQLKILERNGVCGTQPNKTTANNGILVKSGSPSLV